MSEIERFEFFDRLTRNVSELILAAEQGQGRSWQDLDGVTDQLVEAIDEILEQGPLEIPAEFVAH